MLLFSGSRLSKANMGEVNDMPAPIPPFRITDTWKLFTTHDQLLLLVSVFLQLVLALLFGHFYDMRISMG
jgi:hypothetical protein